MAIKIYKDVNNVVFNNTEIDQTVIFAQDDDIFASVNSDDSDAIDVRTGQTVAKDSDVKIYFGVDYTLFQDESGTALGASASATATAINDIFSAHVSRGIFRGLLIGDTDAESIGVGSGVIKFQVGDTFANFGNVKGYYVVDTAFDFTKQSNVTQAVLHYNTHSTKVTKVAVSGDSKLVDLDPTTGSDAFSESMDTFQITTSTGTTIIPGTNGLVVAGNTSTTGDLTSTGTATLSGIEYPTTDGTSGQVLKTDGSGTLSFADEGGVSSIEGLDGDVTLTAGSGISISDNGSDAITISSTASGGATTTVHYARMSMSSAVLKDGASQQNFTSPTDVDVQFDTQDDVNGTDITTDTSAYSMTVSTAGYYRLTCNMSFHSTSARTTPGIRFNVNGTNIPGESMGYIRAASGQNENTNNLTRVIELAANDEITVCAHDESTVSGNIYAEQAIFEVEKLEVSIDADFDNITNTPTTLAGYGITDSLQLGTTSSTALAGDTTTITSAQASEITANTAKTSFPGFGTTAGTALEGDTALFDGAYSSLTGVPSAFTPSSHTHTHDDITDFDTAVNGLIQNTNLDSLNDVNITSIASGEILKWDGSEWVNNTLSQAGIAAASDVFSGAYADLTGKPTIPNTLATANQTLSGDRKIICATNDLEIENPGVFQIENSSGSAVFKVTPGSPSTIEMVGTVKFDSGLQSGGSIRLEEFNGAGSSAVVLRAPGSLSADVTYTLPATDGSSGQVIQTDGSGNLSFADQSSGGGATYTFWDAGRRQWSGSQDNYFHIGDYSFGLSDNSKNGTRSSYSTSGTQSNLIDDFFINSFVVPAACTTCSIRGAIATTSSALQEIPITVYVFALRLVNPSGGTNQHTVTQLISDTTELPQDTRRVIPYSSTASSLSLAAGDMIHVVFKPADVSTTGTHYLQYNHTITLS